MAKSGVHPVSWQKLKHLQAIFHQDQRPAFDIWSKKQAPWWTHNLFIQHQAPKEIVELLAKDYPQSTSSKDNRGGAIQFSRCLRGRSSSVCCRFPNQVLPPGCRCTWWIWQDTLDGLQLENDARRNTFKTPEQSLLTVVKLLMKEVPETTKTEDHDGANALEYVLKGSTHIGIL